MPAAFALTRLILTASGNSPEGVTPSFFHYDSSESPLQIQIC